MILRILRIIIHSVILFLKKWTYCIQPSFIQLWQSILYWVECSCMQLVSMAKGQSNQIKEKFKNFNFSPLHNNTPVNGKMSSSLCSTIFFNFYVHCFFNKDMYFILVWWNTQYSTYMVYTGLCSSTARWTLAPNFCFWATRKSQIFDTNHMLDNLDFSGSEH